MTFYFICGSFQASILLFKFSSYTTFPWPGISSPWQLFTTECAKFLSSLVDYYEMQHRLTPTLGSIVIQSFIPSTNINSYTQYVLVYFTLKQSSLRIIYWFRNGNSISLPQIYFWVVTWWQVLLFKVRKHQNTPCIWESVFQMWAEVDWKGTS